MTTSDAQLRVFITGASGFIGRALADRYRSMGAEVVGIDLVADPERGVIGGDVSRPGAWQQAAAGCDLVIHTAALVSYAIDLDSAWRVNVVGTRNVLDAAVAGGVGRFVHLSSIVVYPDLDVPGGMDEKTPVATDGRPYVDTKVASEQVVLQAQAAGEVEVTVVRPGDVYGPGSKPWVILPVEAIKKNAFVLPANGRGRFAPVYVDNLADGIVLTASEPQAAGEVFCLTDGAAITCAEYFGHFFRMLDKRGPINVSTPVAMGMAAAVDRASRLVGRRTESNPATVRYLTRKGGYSIEKARTVLGYEPTVAIDEGMRRTEAWLRDAGII